FFFFSSRRRHTRFSRDWSADVCSSDLGRRRDRRHRRPAGAAPARGRSMSDDRTLALAGLAQALKQVRRIAETGQADAAVLATSLESVFHTDAPSVEAVYGGVDGVRPGLRLLHGYLNNLPDDEQLPKLALAVLQLERRFVNDHDMVQRVRRGIVAGRNEAQRAGSSTHPEVLATLGT